MPAGSASRGSACGSYSYSRSPLPSRATRLTSAPAGSPSREPVAREPAPREPEAKKEALTVTRVKEEPSPSVRGRSIIYPEAASKAPPTAPQQQWEPPPTAAATGPDLRFSPFFCDECNTECDYCQETAGVRRCLRCRAALAIAILSDLIRAPRDYGRRLPQNFVETVLILDALWAPLTRARARRLRAEIEASRAPAASSSPAVPAGHHPPAASGVPLSNSYRAGG